MLDLTRAISFRVEQVSAGRAIKTRRRSHDRGGKLAVRGGGQTGSEEFMGERYHQLLIPRLHRASRKPDNPIANT